jgi:hypothetical protein
MWICGLQIQAGILHEASNVLRESLRIVSIRYQRGITNELTSNWPPVSSIPGCAIAGGAK